MKSRFIPMFILLLLLLSLQLGAQQRIKPFNRVVILIDRSGSFASRLAVAGEAAWKYIRALSNTSAYDEVYVIGVDAAPNQLVYIRGIRSRRDAETTFKTAFRAAARGLGTDWVTGLQMAAEDFRLKPQAASNHLLVFGDLLVDNARHPLTHRLLRRFDRMEQFRWKSLEGVTCWFLYANEDVKRQLLKRADFQALNPTIWSVETEARLSDIKPPAHPKSPVASASAGGGIPVAMIAIGVATLLLAGALALTNRRPNGGNR